MMQIMNSNSNEAIPFDKLFGAIPKHKENYQHSKVKTEKGEFIKNLRNPDFTIIQEQLTTES